MNRTLSMPTESVLGIGTR